MPALSNSVFTAIKTARNHVLFALLLLPATPLVLAQDDDQTPKPAKLFTTSETLVVTMTGPFRDIERKEKYQGTYPAKIEFTDELGNATSLEMTVERRGLTRQVVCRYPPIKLRFDKEAVKGTTFRGQKGLKMVTHCDKASKFEQYYILEMLAYQMYNLITDFSFRVRPLSVTYVDSETGDTQEPHFAFLIEDDGDVAKRNGQKKLQIPRARISWLDPKETSNVSLFQFMIANLDFAVLNGPDTKECCHNSKLIGQVPGEDPIYPIPYDFDASGLVNAPYAAPPEGLPVKKVTQRLYRGICKQNDALPAARQKFLDNEGAILALVNNETRLNDKSRQKTIKFLGQFFKIMKSDKDFERQIIGKCRK
jgi:hypothetical protein